MVYGSNIERVLLGYYFIFKNLHFECRSLLSARRYEEQAGSLEEQNKNTRA